MCRAVSCKSCYPNDKKFKFCEKAVLSVAGPKAWNSLPDSLRDPAVESERFLDLKKHLRRTLELGIIYPSHKGGVHR